MTFRTKLDYSSNRQIRQSEKTNTILSGGTTFGLPFSALTYGPDSTLSGISSTQLNLVSTFSGNTGTTIYTWFDTRMSLGYSSLPPLTAANSGTTQNTGNIFTASTTTIIDGNTSALFYTGVSFDISVIAMVDLGGGNLSGSVYTNTFETLSASSLDYTGRTIWVDVSGITRTTDLIITNSPVIGTVWTCIDTEGRGVWASAGTISFSGTGPNSIAMGVSPISSGNTSVSIGNTTIAGGNYSNASGRNTTASGQGSNASNEGTVASGQDSHAEGTNTTASNLSSHSEGFNTTASGTNSHSEGNSTTASASYSHAEGYHTTANGIQSHAEGFFSVATGSISHAEGSSTTAIGFASHSEGVNTTANGTASHAGGGLTIASGDGSFIHSSASTVTGDRSVVIGGQGITGASNDYVYVPSLNIKTVGSSAFANDIRIDATGNLTTNTSDIRFKENINSITNALDRIKQLRGVTYQWKDKIAGGNGIKLGFIAQEVETVVSDLVFENKVDGYKGIHIDGVIPLLVEAVKELSQTITGTSYIETQTIFAEDNDIVLNYSGTQKTAIGGGISVLHALGQGSNADLKTDENGNWVTNNDFKSQKLSIPKYTPYSSVDEYGNVGNITGDENYLYFKVENNKWKRVKLEDF